MKSLFQWLPSANRARTTLAAFFLSLFVFSAAQAQPLALLTRVEFQESQLTKESKEYLDAQRKQFRTRNFGFYRLNRSALDQPAFTVSYPGKEHELIEAPFKKHGTIWIAGRSAGWPTVTLFFNGNSISQGSILSTGKGFHILPTSADGIFMIVDNNSTENMQDHGPNRPRHEAPPPNLVKDEEEYQRKRRERQTRPQSFRSPASAVVAGSQVAASIEAPTDIDVIVGITPAARAFMGGSSTSIQLVAQRFIETNTSFINSNVTVRINLIDVFLFETSENGKSADVLRNEFSNNPGVLTARNAISADLGLLIALLPDSDYECGVAPPGLPSPSRIFALVNARCLASDASFSLSHEIGHLLGADHNMTATGQPPEDQSWIAQGWPSSQTIFRYGYWMCWHTIMGYPVRNLLSPTLVQRYGTINSCVTTRIPHWSNTTTAALSPPPNPNVPPELNQGYKPYIGMGYSASVARDILHVPGGADNASVINMNSLTVAAFRTPLPTPLPILRNILGWITRIVTL